MLSAVYPRKRTLPGIHFPREPLPVARGMEMQTKSLLNESICISDQGCGTYVSPRSLNFNAIVIPSQILNTWPKTRQSTKPPKSESEKILTTDIGSKTDSIQNTPTLTEWSAHSKEYSKEMSAILTQKCSKMFKKIMFSTVHAFKHGSTKRWNAARVEASVCLPPTG